MERKYQEGVTVGELCRMIGRHLWAVILASIVFAAAFTLLFAFVINPLGREYSMQFYLTYPASDTLKYPDGSAFSYREFTSYEALAAAKASDERFGSIDIDKMVKEDDVSVTAEFVTTADGYTQTGNYTIAVQGKYFSSRETAQAFIRALAQTAVDNVKEKAASIGYSIDADVFTEASFEDRLSLLSEERDSILAAYDEWIAEYRAGYSVGGKTLSAYRAEAAVACGESVIESLRNELTTRGYVSLDEMEGRIAELKREQVLNEEKIEALRETIGSMSATVGSDSAIAEMIAELVVRNVQIESEIASLTEANITAFDARVNAQYERLQACAETVQAVSVALYEQETAVHFATYRAVISGDTNLAVAAVAGLILGFIIVSIIVCSREYKRSVRAAREDASSGKDAANEKDTRA